jgi:rod shape-determining protein MreD
MRSRRILIAAGVLLAAVALQTSLFVRIRPFDVAPSLVLVVVIGYARHLQAETAILLGFGAGLVQDLMAVSPLGLWALVMSSSAYAVVRFGGQIDEDFGTLAPFVFAVSFGALALFAVLGTIFGEKTLADGGMVKKLLVPAIYNVVLSFAVLPFVAWTVGASRRGRSELRL